MKSTFAMDKGKSESAHRTGEAGEPSHGTPSRESALLVTEPLEGKTAGQPAPSNVYTKLERIAERARERPDEVITMISHLIDVEWLKESWRLTRKDGASGVDGVTAREYEEKLDENLSSLLERFKSGTYRAPPVKRANIPKGDGKTRPIGIPTFEDKVLQRAVAMMLEAIYEQKFRNCSYGFRPRRSAHQALDALWRGLMNIGDCYVIDVDIRSFFDSLDHAHLRSFLDLRVRDGVIRRAIDKWLKAGVLDDGRLVRPEEGTPQGGVISPLLANIFLHHVLDAWFEDEIKPLLLNKSFVVRYADDFVIVLRSGEDARRVMGVLSKRFEKYGLTLHPEKTRMLHFRVPEAGKSDDDDDGASSFDFLGFTHFRAKSRKGNSVVKQKTASTRVRRTLKRIGDWCKANRHKPIRAQHSSLCAKLRGHYSYFGITGNSDRITAVFSLTERLWQYWLNRRSSRRSMRWERFLALLERFPLPRPRIVRRPLAARP